MDYIRKNWAGVEVWHPSQIANPASLEELRQVILKAQAEKMKIRVVGSLHSYICETPGLQLHTDKLCRILSLDKAKGWVRVEAGMKMRKLVEYLASQGLALPNQGYILKQSIAGVISTATHGTGKTGTLSSFVEEIELVDASGNLRALNAKTNPHLFNAAVVSLGCLGVIYAVTLRCVPLFKLDLSLTQSTFAETAQELPELIKEYDHFQWIVDPYSDSSLKFAAKRTSADKHTTVWYQVNRFLRTGANIAMMDYLPSISWLNRRLLRTLYFPFLSFKTRVVDDGYRLLSPSDEPHYVEEEIAVPAESAEKAFSEMRHLVTEFTTKNGPDVIALVCRFVEADSYGYLSPTQGRRSAYIVPVMRLKSQYKELYKQFETAMLKYSGRPHWGKYHTLTPDMIQKLYGENYTQFIEARRELNPEGVFLNKAMEALFK